MKNIYVLVIDDVELIRKSIFNHLLSLGLLNSNIVLCASGDEAYYLLNSHQFDFIITDLLMDKGDGFSFIRKLIKINYRTALIVMSSLDKELVDMSYQLTRNAGNNLIMLGSFQKPLRKCQLKALIETNIHISNSLETFPLALQAKREKFFKLEDVLCNKMLSDTGDTPFKMYYQPKICSKTGLIKSYEALARLYSPDSGIVPPDIFIPELEKKKLMESFTYLTIKLCVLDIEKIKSTLGIHIKVAINIPTDIFCLEHFPDTFISLTKTVPANNLTIEITESKKENGQDDFMLNASRIRMRNIGLSIDDFGTEHSNLNRLAHIPFTELKIDKLYVMNLSENPKTLILITTIVEMAYKLGLKVVAEGVETSVIARELINIGVDELQGYYYSQPISFNLLINLLVEDKKFDCMTGKKGNRSPEVGCI